jgi:hypothetical protein
MASLFSKIDKSETSFPYRDMTRSRALVEIVGGDARGTIKPALDLVYA